MTIYDITSYTNSGILLTNGSYGSPLTVTSSGTVNASGTTIALNGSSATSAWTIVNEGLIHGYYGVVLGHGGLVSNTAGGTITGAGSGDGIKFSNTTVAGSVINAGSIGGGSNNTLGGGIAFLGLGSVTNLAGAAITDGHDGLFFHGASGTVYNGGAISGGRYGIYFFLGGTVTNVAGGTITSNYVGILDSGGAATIRNAGSISGATNTGIRLPEGGAISNAAGGAITSSGGNGIASGAGHLAASLSVRNAGAISGGGSGIVLLNSRMTASIYNSGRISGASGAGISTADGGTVTNAAGGTITGGTYGVKLSGAAGTVTNAGSIGGVTDAVDFAHSGSNRLIVDAGASFSGAVTAAGTGNVIELASSATAGTLSGLGSEYLGFQTVTIDSGAAWKVTGTEAAFGATTIGGFTANDTLYITNLSYVPGATATLSGGTLAVVSGGTTIDIAMTSVTGTTFYAHDVGGEVLINESSIACYCRGTLVKTGRGQVPVEELQVGDLLVTLSGALKPIKWIGRRSYAGWLAAGNPDVQPVLFKAGALADNVPSRDLMVSPEHAMYLDGALIPARHLVNGISILQTRGMEEIHYFHLELEDHAVIFAEDAASETYVDDGNRFMFHNVFDYYAEFPDAPRGGDAAYCAPRIEDGFELEAVRRVLAARARRLRPDGTAAPAAELRGHLERVTRTLVEGWAEGPDPLAILDNGAVIGRVTPGRDHRFRFAMPSGFWPEVRHEIEVRRDHDWTLLQGSGAVLEAEALAA